MPKLVLTYFDFDGSRGEVARLAMYIAGIEFEDRRIARNDWSAATGRWRTRSASVGKYRSEITCSRAKATSPAATPSGSET